MLRLWTASNVDAPLLQSSLAETFRLGNQTKNRALFYNILPPEG